MTLTLPMLMVLPVHTRKRVGVERDGLPGGVQQRDGGEDREGAEGDDERRQVQPGDEHTVEQPGEQADADPDQQRDQARGRRGRG